MSGDSNPEGVTLVRCAASAQSPAQRILITRPTGQHENLQNGCLAMGLDVIHWPCLIIEPFISCHTASVLQTANGPVLFTSSNAVAFAHRIRAFPWQGVQTYAIGAATASALSKLGQTLVAAPVAPYNSESFLHQIASQSAHSLLIVKGVGGRTLIQDDLQNKGWQVQTVDVYQRQIPRNQTAQADYVFGHGLVSLISVSSNEVLYNLISLSAAHDEHLYSSQLIVNSQRSAQLALQRGFIVSPLVAQPAGDQGQLNCIRQWLSKTKQAIQE